MIERMTKLMDYTKQSTRMSEVLAGAESFGDPCDLTRRIQTHVVRQKEVSDEVRLLLEIIKYKKWQLEKFGFQPKRVYMSFRTKRKLHGGLYTPCLVTVVPHGRERRDTILGLDIHEADIPDYTVDIGCD